MNSGLIVSATGEIAVENLVVCQFCKRPAPYTCDWRVERFVRTPTVELQTGDIVERTGGKREHLVVVSITRPPRSPYLYVNLSTVCHRAGEWVGLGQRSQRELGAFGYVDALRRVPCGAPACEAHVREPGEGVHWCQDHWAACTDETHETRWQRQIKGIAARRKARAFEHSLAATAGGKRGGR